MVCQTNLITTDKGTPSKTGLYANGLPGVTLRLLDDLTKDEQEDYLEFWEDIYQRSWDNFVSDMQTLLADKFHIDLKLVSRETSKFTADSNQATELAGILLEFDLPRYARIHIVSIGVKSVGVVASPGADFTIWDAEDGNLLETVSEELEDGSNEVSINQSFEPSTDKLFIAFDPTQIELKKTENRYFASDDLAEDKLSCSFPCGYGEGSVRQINGGGLNVTFNIFCSIEKFLCQNINLFKMAFWYRIGVELMMERILTDRLNRFTALTPETAEEKKALYEAQYDKHLKNSVRNLSMREDPICFNCKSAVDSTTVLP